MRQVTIVTIAPRSSFGEAGWAASDIQPAPAQAEWDRQAGRSDICA